MFDIFSSAHSEQRAVLFEGSEELSVKTAKLMLSRLYTDYYNDTERERAIYVLTKLGYLEADAKRESKESESSLLDKANETIRKANHRINELKSLLSEAERKIDFLTQENFNLSSQLFESDCSLTERDILGYESLPSRQELRKRYKSLASIHHPDKGGSKAMMQRINDSYEKLKNEVA
ncbi:J domain-containing protein [Vibrio parahaemolyticus]|nr:J domain-containing protein [Vibrio parahaemolyticus]MDF4466919.1 J domain-containing protein [Vibrio parahaemolyticus]MDF4471647.1 J domain-containing protein [Vibrio parahaemolyticus]MDF4494863.1 J domain-containing protein [Vibrio parahaemolyticus]MDG2570448.1 J domain-containing protein [Vibrio parahaemolyticus]